MNCPNCNAEIPEGSRFCSRCGVAAQPSEAVAHLDFTGTPAQWLGWTLLGIVSLVVVIPYAWALAASTRWFCRHLKFSDGTTAAFRGTGGQIAGWIILYLILNVAARLAYTPAALQRFGNALLVLPVIFYLFVAPAIILKVVHWSVSHFQLSSGPQLSFDGSYWGVLGWLLLMGVSIYSIVGWAWAEAGFFRWYARHTHGDGIRFQFHGKGQQILWRTLVTILACVLVIPIPWMVIWYARWFIQNVSMARIAQTAMAAPA